MSRTARILAVFGAAVIVALGIQGAGAAPSGATVHRSPYQLAQARFERHLAQMRLRARPHPALPRPGEAAVGSPSVPGQTQQIGADTAPRPEPRFAQPDTTIEPDIALDPNNPNDIVAVYQEGRFRNGAAVDIGFATSLDGGRTWVHGNMPHLTQAVGGEWERASDPAVAFGPDHAVYVNSLVVSFHAGVSGMAVQRSTDGGRTWSDPVTVQRDDTSQAFNDKNWIAVDTFASTRTSAGSTSPGIDPTRAASRSSFDTRTMAVRPGAT
jgi:hypothetical protein